jgi:hypothetical protein
LGEWRTFWQHFSFWSPLQHWSSRTYLFQNCLIGVWVHFLCMGSGGWPPTEEWFIWKSFYSKIRINTCNIQSTHRITYVNNWTIVDSTWGYCLPISSQSQLSFYFRLTQVILPLSFSYVFWCRWGARWRRW